MKSTITFIPELRDYLALHGDIYTVRSYRFWSVWSATLHHVTIPCMDGNYVQRFVKDVYSQSDIEEFAERSGFPTVEAWWDKVLYFYPDFTPPLFLYRVTLDSPGGEVV